LNIVGRLGPSPTLNGNATPTADDGITTNGLAQRQRLKRPRFEVDEDVVITNGNGH
jgi:hypothetical protein